MCGDRKMTEQCDERSMVEFFLMEKKLWRMVWGQEKGKKDYKEIKPKVKKNKAA